MESFLTPMCPCWWSFRYRLLMSWPGLLGSWTLWADCVVTQGGSHLYMWDASWMDLASATWGWWAVPFLLYHVHYFRDGVTTLTEECWTLRAGHEVMGGGSCLYAQALVGQTWLQLHRDGELRLPRCTVSIILETDNGVHLRWPDLGAWGCVAVDYQTSILHVFHNYLY